MLRLLVWLLILAAALYVIFWALDRRAGAGDEDRSGGPRRRAPQGPRGPLGPDDDEEFLRELDRRRRDGP
ncbi:hypothetical protein [Nocardioides terrisoli]|uniref:hypothetical protein n=1 Tax=Nocardioides terrisoli TaxID=3388267 RepID=UPI00287BC6B9|nr:hypothetical protein [Nocardioides marmorisolisilvae]